MTSVIFGLVDSQSQPGSTINSTQVVALGRSFVEKLWGAFFSEIETDVATEQVLAIRNILSKLNCPVFGESELEIQLLTNNILQALDLAKKRYFDLIAQIAPGRGQGGQNG